MTVMATPTVEPQPNGAIAPSDNSLAPLAALIRRYVYAYTSCHDFNECRRLMIEDYTLYMGEHTLRGRDASYIPATEKQYRQFPGLALTVHDMVVSPDRIAMAFSEHGRSVLSNSQAVWGGVSLYRWNGTKLTECRVEQDYYARRDQLRRRAPDLIPAPALDPWTGPAQEPNADTERVVRNWLAAGGVFDCPIGSLDNEAHAPARRPLLSNPAVKVLDLFTAGSRAAFHAAIHGRYAGGLDGLDGSRNRRASIYVAGLATVVDGQVVCRAITDRLAAERRLTREL